MENHEIVNGESRESILAKLYAIRSGMSLVSKKRDEIVAVRDKINDKKDQIEKEQEQIKNTQKDIAGSESNLCCEVEFRKKDEYRNLKKYGEIGKWNILISAVIGVLLALSLTIIGVIIDAESSLWSWWHIISVFLFSLLLFFFGTLTIAEAVSGKKRKRIEKNAEQYARHFVEECREKELPLYIAQKKEMIGKIEETIKEIDGSIDLLNREIEDLKEEGISVYNALVDQFGGFLSASDFKNIDLLIYILQSNRADSLKEALHRLDERLFVETIVQTIKDTGNYISQTLTREMNYLGRELKSSIAQLSYSMEQKMKTLNESNKAMELQMSINNALTEKISVDSNRLAEDVAWFRKELEY